jgi:hypothetical protein
MVIIIINRNYQSGRYRTPIHIEYNSVLFVMVISISKIMRPGNDPVIPFRFDLIIRKAVRNQADMFGVTVRPILKS